MHSNPRLVPAQDLLYVQVVKQYKKYREVKVTQKIVFGDSERIESILAASLAFIILPCGIPMNP